MIYAYLKEQIGTDDQTLLDSLYEEYCHTIETKIANIKEALESNNFDLLRKLAHALKGESAMVGDVPMNEHALAFENAAKAMDMKSCQAEFAEICSLAPTTVDCP